MIVAAAVHDAGAYVAAAYATFVLLLGSYLAIILPRAQRVRRELAARRRAPRDAGA